MSTACLLILLVSWLRKGDSCFLPAVANEVTISANKEVKGINSNVAMNSKLNTQSRKSTAHACARTSHAALALGQV